MQNTFGFGTEIEPDTSQNYLIVKHAPFPYPPPSKGQVTGRPTSTDPRPRSSADTAGAGMRFGPTRR